MLEAEGEKVMWQGNESWEWYGAMSQEMQMEKITASYYIYTYIYISFFESTFGFINIVLKNILQNFLCMQSVNTN